ncbi:hypothetical protein HW278_01890 [Capnocytophaga sp. oral taxon 902]|uniref:hypothetical protein n=1 Tax=Capnocytophaga sp. oral taxon 902 TaxID=2748316 RepID=UPI0015B94AFA|nr:hypothetical protein [Capnocytophaga sp. oral taxon 902]QLF49551.1 hypothetical protein HW278_01890 [Capnocytophaga sp. oral taxon 902]
MRKWENVEMGKCGNGKMWKWENVEMGKCGNVGMWKWENGGVGLLGILGEARRDVENLGGEIAKRINILGGTLLLECKMKKRKKTCIIQK